ncbi:MAG TPA: DUF3429 domain-containing protein [Acetobacteraceae bacterium]|jgi:hypothetical protein|nr:DUF3429 domain-containing protein [Acetobacteraceae bacterium]
MAGMPLIVILLSVLGLVPLIGCGLGALGPDPQTATRMLQVLIGYTALTLAFAGGVHWGFELQVPHTNRLVGRLRVGIPAVALLVAWAALVLPIVVAPVSALIVLVAAYIAAILLEQRAAHYDALPRHYLWLRWGFTIPAAAMLVTVLTLRLLGQTIEF